MEASSMTIERGLTTKLSSHSKSGLANALQVPVEYLEAACRGTPIMAVSRLKFCAPCWTPGTPPYTSFYSACVLE